ncbi:MAG TPA: S8 family serine peptidase [Bryobacteraceae bacterium]|nr:S8 family serine peptidase [Bryobacteraceae bacterium]
MNIAIIDSGIHPGHPHVGEVAGGIGIVSADYLDNLGHGTAVAGAIREKVPDASLYAVKVFDRRLSASLDTILRALEWCIAHQMDVINLSLGTANPSHREQFERVLTAASLIVSAADFLPGNLPGVIGAAPEETCPRELFRYRDGIFYASPYPRSIPGVPVERNLHGASFAVANMTGFVARALAGSPRDAIRPALIARATNIP